MGLSWVAVWVVLFTIVVPTSPRRALLAALASVSSVPVVIGLVIAYGTTSVQVVPAMFFLGLVFPVPPRRGHGVCRRPRGVSAGHRSQTCARDWGAIAWRKSSARVGWERSGERGIACWQGLPPSS